MWRRSGEKARIGRRPPAERQDRNGDDTVEVQPVELVGMFAAPRWLRDLGLMSWLLVGVTALLAGLVVLLSMTSTITVPVITAAIVAAVLAPLVDKLEARGMRRAAGTAVVFLVVLAVAVGLTVLLLATVSGRSADLERDLRDAANTVKGWVQDLGVDAKQAESAKNDASSGVSNAFHALLNGIGTGINALASIAVFLSFTALSLFFLLKDGPTIRRWAEAHMGVPEPVAQTITKRTLGALRGYFVGVTAVAAFNAIVIGLGALVLGVPSVGAIAVVNFVAAYIPYLGAWTAGGFTVLLALGTQGTTTALIMGVIILLANGALQQLIQPIAFGAALGIHPLAVLIVTIAGGSLFGGIGLILGAPLTSAAVHISHDLALARARAEAGAAEAPADVGAPLVPSVLGGFGGPDDPRA
jgi:predicted PurR-regulated permease PerM